MLRIFYGNDRVKTQKEIRRILGEDYEVVEGADLKLVDLPSVFMGSSLLTSERKILIKELSAVKENFEKLEDYLDAPNEIIIWENNVDKRTSLYKKLVKKAEVREFKLIEKIDKNLAFNIYDVALYDGKKAIRMLDKVMLTDDPYKIVGAWAWKAIDNFKKRGGRKEKRVLLELSKLDMLMKTTSCQPWTLLRAFLLQVSEW